MKKILIPSLLFAASVLSSCSHVPSGYISKDEVESIVSTYTDKEYSKYSYVGEMNFFNFTYNDYNVDETDKSYSVENTSFYLRVPTKLSGETFESDYKSIFEKFTTADSVDTVYCYKTDEGGLEFKVFSINKRLSIREFSILCSAKWNATISYDSDGYLLREEFATINADFDPLSETVFGYCDYTYL